MGMSTDEEVTYDMARRTVSDWRLQLKRIQQRPASTLQPFERGMAEGLAQAIREMDRVLDSSPVCARYMEAAQPSRDAMAAAMNRTPDPATDEGYGPRAVND